MPSLKGTSQNVVESMISTSLSSIPWKNADLALTNIDKHKDYKKILEKFDSFFQGTSQNVVESMICTSSSSTPWYDSDRTVHQS